MRDSDSIECDVLCCCQHDSGAILPNMVDRHSKPPARIPRPITATYEASRTAITRSSAGSGSIAPSPFGPVSSQVVSDLHTVCVCVCMCAFSWPVFPSHMLLPAMTCSCSVQAANRQTATSHSHQLDSVCVCVHVVFVDQVLAQRPTTSTVEAAQRSAALKAATLVTRSSLPVRRPFGSGGGNYGPSGQRKPLGTYTHTYATIDRASLQAVQRL